MTIISAPARVPRGALEEFRAAGRLQPQLASSLALSSQMTGWLLATQARPRLTGEAQGRARLLASEGTWPAFQKFCS